MRFLFFLGLSFMSIGLFGQQDSLVQIDSFIAIDSLSYEAEILAFQTQLNEDYSSEETSPLTAEQLEKFEAHAFFPIDSNYRIVARFEKASIDTSIQMPTSSDRLAEYRIFGTAYFELDSNDYSLVLYQSVRLMRMEEYKDYLFLPFNDHTNGEDSYGGGRYIDMKIPSSNDSIIIDFNKAYHPYCAYTDGYSCPVPPPENNLGLRIEAGIRLTDDAH